MCRPSQPPHPPDLRQDRRPVSCACATQPLPLTGNKRKPNDHGSREAVAEALTLGYVNA